MIAASVPPVLQPPVPRASTRRVALGLMLYGFLDLAMSAFMLLAWLPGDGLSIQLNLVPGFVFYWIAAWLVWNEKGAIWPILAYLSAVALGSVLGSGIGLGLGLPSKLIAAFFRYEAFWFWIYTVNGVLLALFTSWLLREALAIRPSWHGGGLRQPWLQPRVFLAGAALLSVAATWGGLALLQAGWTDGVVTRARGEHGEDCDYLPLSYHSVTRNGQTTYDAVVLAYSDNQFQRVSLHWTD